MGCWGIALPNFSGTYDYRIERGGETIDTGNIKNAVTNDGLVAGLNVLFFGGTKTQDWYLGLMNVNTPGGTVVTTEWTGYNESTRPAWTSGIVSIGDHRAVDTYADSLSVRVDCTEFAVFTATETAYLNQPFLSTNSTKNSTIGTVWSRGAVTGSVNQQTARQITGATSAVGRGTIIVWPGDVLRLGYTLHAGQATGSTVLTGSKLWLDCMFKGTTAPTTWYVGLIANEDGDLRAIDTMATHNWTEFTGYQGPRPVFTPRDAWSLWSSASNSDTSTPAFTETDALKFRITSTGTVGCFFIVASDNTKGGTGGTLYCQEGIEYQRRHLGSGAQVFPFSQIGDTDYGSGNGMLYPIPVYRAEQFKLRFRGTTVN